MPETISPRARAIMDDLPPFYGDDPHALSVVDALARELDRVEARANDLRQEWFPQNADDDHLILSLYETLLGLPVAPDGIAVAQRRDKVLAQLRKRNTASGEAWVATLGQAFGSETWSHHEGPTAYTVYITMPFDSATYASRQIETLARQITPAHLALSFIYGAGFIVTESLLSSDRL